MEQKATRPVAVRFGSFLLALVMVFTLLPVNAFAAAPSLKITNSEGEEADTFVIGEPIFVTAESGSGDRVAMYTEGQANGSSYWFWYYVEGSYSREGLEWEWTNGEAYNIYDTVCYKHDYEGDVLEPGKYVIRLENNTSVTKTITLVAPEDASVKSLEVETTQVVTGDPIKVTATSYADYAWVGLYNGHVDAPNGTSLNFYYTNGHNGLPMEFEVEGPGDYTVILFKDGGYDVEKVIHVTVSDPVDETPLKITNSKGQETDTFVVGEPIFVTAYSEIAGDWVGLYAAGHPDKSACWYYVNQDGHVNGKTYNIFDYPDNGWDGYPMPVGTHTIKLVESGISKNITVVAPENSDTSLELEKNEVAYGDPIRVKTTTYADCAWVAFYAGTRSASESFGGDYLTFYYTCGQNGLYKEHTLDQGDYTVVLFKDGGYTVDKVAHVTVQEPEEPKPLLATDKTEYKYGEPIMVTTNYFAANAWVGIYKKGESYNPDTGGKYSIYWYYLSEQTNPVDIRKTRDENGRSGEFVAGEYTVVLFQDGGYTPKMTVDIVITKEVVSTTTEEATCEQDGKTVTTYNDGTKDETPIPAKGHAYGEWEYDANTRSHIKTCANDVSHKVTEKCTFDEGVVMKEATETENGVMLYTCSVCGGTYEDEISVKQVVKEEVTKEATCEEAGEMLVTYDDGSTATKVIPAKGHTYGDWVHDAEKHTHSKTCVNDPAHVITEDCSYQAGTFAENGKLTQVCSVCKGERTVTVLSTDKTVYSWSESIYVTVDTSAYGSAAKDWVGIFRKTDTIGDDDSFYWYYLGDKGDNKNVNIFSGTQNLRPDGYSVGEYQIVLLADDSYTILTSIDITVIKTPVSEVTTPATCEADGKIVTTYDDGSVETTVIPMLGHDYSDWSYDAATRHHTKTCANDGTHIISENCSFDKGVVTKEPTEIENGVMLYTCTVCGGTYEDVISVKQVVSEEVTKEATCEEPGEMLVTYDDGSTTTKVIPAKGHAYGDWTHDAENHKHTKVCANDPAHVITEDCSYQAGGYDNGQLTKVCSVCKGEHSVTVLSTDKTVYSWNDRILVTVDTSAYPSAVKDWVGIFRKGEVPGSDVISYYWYYLGDQEDNHNVDLYSKTAQIRPDPFTVGEYSIVLLADDGYTVLTSVDITIVRTPVSEVTEPATCEADGKTIITYDDGSTEVTILPRLGHDWGEWEYNGAEHKDHTRTCKRDASHTETENCSFGEGVVTKEPTDTEAGEKTYTCTVCEGTYTEAYSDKEVDRTEVLKEATCTEDGVLRTYYKDGTYIDTPILKTGHAYGDWVYNAEDKCHTRTCTNDASHTETELCVFELDSYGNNAAVYVCRTCGGSYNSPLLSTDKTVYEYGDPIMVTTDYNGGDMDWVGLYKKGDNYVNGAVNSIYWYYLYEESNPTNILGTRDENGRGGEFVAGEYTIILFHNGSYDAVATVDITITKSEVSRSTTPATCEQDGKTVITYSDGTQDITVHPKLGHEWSDWTYDAEKRQHVKVCGNDATHEIHEDCSFGEGEIIEEATEEKHGTKKYTCSVCQGSYTEEYSILEVDRTEVLKAATCEEAGILRTYYVDGSYIDTVIPKLGHEWGDWTHNEDTKTHTRVCKHDETHTETADCVLGDPVVETDGVSYTCTVCGGVIKSGLLVTNKTQYQLGEAIMVTAFAGPDGSWVGLYGADETPGDVYSYNWYNVYNTGAGLDRIGQSINIASPELMEPGRNESLSNGEYKIILFGDQGYDKILATVYITIFTDTSNNTYDIALNGVSYADGASVLYTEGTSVKMTVTGEGELGNGWVGIYPAIYEKEFDFSTLTSIYWHYIADHNGKAVNLNGQLDGMPAGSYTIAIFADGGWSDVRKVVYITVEKEASNSAIITPPTCTEYGVEYVTYDDGTSAYRPIAPLGHDYGENPWVIDEVKHTHTNTCNRCKKTVTANCSFNEEIIREATETEPGLKKYTCRICGLSYEEEYGMEPVVDTTVSRLYGDNRISTAIGIADQLKARLGLEKFSTIIIACATNYADALSGSYLAGVKNAPILLGWNGDAKYDYLNDEVVAYVRENLAEGGTVYILGGDKAVPASVDAALQAAGCTNIKRLAGENRFETNLLILKEAGVTGGELIVCTGTNFADALSASAVDVPILMVYNDLYESQKEFLDGMNARKFYIIGGEKAVNFDIETVLRGHAATMRIGGANRYETSVMIAERFFENPDTAVLAYAWNFPDGLCGGQLAMSMGAPLILTYTEGIDAAAAYAKKCGISAGTVLGGTGLISDSAVRDIFRMENGNNIVQICK